MKKQLIGSVLVALLTIGGVGQRSAAADDNVIEEVVVTAQKREQSLQDVPLAIQVTDGDFLDRNNIKSLREAVNFIPGAAQGEALSTEQTRIQLRGIPQIVGDPTLGYYIGDTPFYFPLMLWAPVVRTSGLERIEVVKGPQSTLYGNGAMGGVLRVIPKQPDLEEFDAAINVGFTSIEEGEDGHYGDASVSIPLVEGKAGLRVSAGMEKTGGWIDVQPHAINFATFAYEPSGPPREDFGENDVTDYRVQLLVEPTDKLSLEFMVQHNESETSPTGFVGIDTDDPPTSTDATPSLTFDNTDYDLYSGKISYDFESVTVTSVFTQLDYEELWQSSFISNFGLPSAVAYDADSFSNETRLVSNFDGPFQFVAGIYYVDAEVEVLIDVAEFPLLMVPRILSTASIESEQKSVFGEVTYDLNDQWTALVGLRWFEDDRTVAENDNIGGFPIPYPTSEDTFDSVNPRFNLSYMPDENRHYYFNAAKGFRSGIFNGVSSCASIPAMSPLAAACPATVDSDELWSYEIGTKQTLADGAVILDASLYYQDWTDVQGAARLGTITTSFQLGDVDGFGIDLGLTWRPEAVPGLNLIVAANWNNLEFSSLDPVIESAMGPFFSEGDDVPGTPPWSASISALYGWQISDTIGGDLLVSYSHKDGYSASVGSLDEADTQSYLNMRFSLLFGENFAVSLFGNNLTDEDGSLFVQSGPLYAGDLKTIPTPREFGIELSYQM